MLILTRRIGEKLVIDVPGLKTPVTVTVLGIKGNQVRIGTDAPKDIPVHREEIYKRIVKEREAEAASKVLAALEAERGERPL